MPKTSEAIKTIAAWSIYPASWLLLIVAYVAALNNYLGFQAAWGLLIVTLFAGYAILERLLPYEKRWSMTWASLVVDMKYIATNVVFIIALNAALSLLTINLAANRIGPAHDWPLWLQLAACLLVFEALNYSVHRAMHEAPGRVGRLLWNIHVAHHLPERVYVVMHAVFHPLNAFLVQALAMTLPIWLAGYDQRVVTLFLMINGMHGLIGHFNVDIRMGWANYIFVGAELHRYHHSADVAEARNYGATLSIYDVLFGTFVYKPGIAPKSLGVANAGAAPGHSDFLAVLALPFKAGIRSGS